MNQEDLGNGAQTTPFTHQDEYRERAAANAVNQQNLVVSDSTDAATDSATIPDNESILPERATEDAYANSVTYYGSSKEESQRIEPVDPPLKDESEMEETAAEAATFPLWGWLIAALALGAIIWRM